MAPRKRAISPARRKPGTGTIRYKKGRQQPYEAAFPLGHGQHRHDYFSSRQAAAAHLDRLTAEAGEPVPRDIAGGSLRVDQFLPTWLTSKHHKVKEKTWLNYKYLCELACGEIGDYRVDQLTRPRVDAMLDYFHSEGFQNVSQMRAVLRQAFEYALEEDYVRKNPFQKVKVAPVERRKAIALTRAQRGQLLAVLVGHPLEALFHLYSRLGLRRGEGLGIRWSDLDLGRGILHVTQQYTEAGSKTVRSTPKTPRSTRIVPLPRDIIDMLVALRPRQQARAARSAAWQDHGLVFPSERGTPLIPRNLVNRYKGWLEQAGLPREVTIHDLRHTALALLEQDGVPQSTRMAIAGHSSATMANLYADHADIDAMRRALEGD